MAVSGLRLELLGGVELRGAPREEADRVLVQPKLVALLAYLALNAGKSRYQRRDHLVGLAGARPGARAHGVAEGGPRHPQCI